MLGASILDAFKLRFAWWAVELALPSKAELKRRLTFGLLGVLAAVAGGVLAALTIAGLLAGAGFALYQAALLTAAQAVGAALAGFALFAVLLLCAGKAWFGKMFRASSHHSASEDDDVLKGMLNGFLEGLLNERAGSSTRTSAYAAEESVEEGAAPLHRAA